MSEMARAAESFGIRCGTCGHESGRETAQLVVKKYDGDMANWITRKDGITAPKEADFQRHKITPYQTVIAMGNLLTQAGWGRILNLAIASGGTQAWDATHCRIGVGTGTTAATTGDVDLAAPSGATGSRSFRLVVGFVKTGL